MTSTEFIDGEPPILPALALPSLAIGDDEERAMSYLSGKLSHYRSVNQLKQRYYDGEHRPRQFDIAVPPDLRDVDAVIGWPAVVVDTLEERLDFLGWGSVDGDSLGLGEIYDDNHLDIESGMVNIEALTNGMGYMTVGSGADGEPEVLVTAEASSDCVGYYDRRSRRLTAALSETLDESGNVELRTLYLPDTTIVYEPNGRSGLTVAYRDDHGRGRVPVVRFPNRERPSDVLGRSEITRAVRYLTDAAMRTALGMEINREFYTAPQRYALGADPAQFGITDDMTDAEKKARIDAWVPDCI